jgi:uroporphyrin-III C-methyltransferase
MQNQGKIIILGAGPGDKELITVKGKNAIASADVILYDALVNKELLLEAKNNCKLIYVGKRAGKHKMPQEKINALLVDCAYEMEVVVRLKGGDPFIFGRGHEELEYCRKAGFDVEIIPGLSSSTALPLLQHVPLTRRGISESFWVITGTTSAHQLSGDISIAMQTSATLVILMGIRKLPQIASLLLSLGKESTPIMIIQNGSRVDEKFIISDALHIVEDAQREKIGAPGIIVIGEVVSLHPQMVISKSNKLWRA